ncbi:MAG: hypothetical protein ACK5UX_17055 [Burkholderiales bacterium]
MNTKKPLYKLEVPSTAFTTEAYLDCAGIEPTIRFAYDVEGLSHNAGIGFHKLAALRLRGERFCSTWHIEVAYDTLVEVENSSWLLELRSDMPDQYQETWPARHYMIYLDSAGCFEFAAESWRALPSVPNIPR